MKLIIAGGRDYELTREDRGWLDDLWVMEGVDEVVSGGAKGADASGEAWAVAREIPVKVFPANWDKHGKAAGPIRNEEMAAYADAVALFPGGRGTESMYQEAKKAGIEIYDFRGGAK